jgi:hypothetical protein
MGSEDAAAARAAEQARLRKERREAKIKAGGASRLNRITGLGGGLQRGMLRILEASKHRTQEDHEKLIEHARLHSSRTRTTANVFSR